MRKILLVVLLAGLGFSAKAQHIPYFFNAGSDQVSESKSTFREDPVSEKGKYDYLLSAIVHRTYDVLKYDLYMDWNDVLLRKGVDSASRVWRGSNKITVRIDSANVKYLEFDAENLQIQSVMVKNFNITPIPQPVKGLLRINLPSTSNTGDTVDVTINYQYIGKTDLGFYLNPEKQYVGLLPNGDSVFVEARLAYTMSEPQDARFWMPCNDAPHDKAIATISVRVPKDFTAVSNGLVYKVDDMNDYKVFTWKDNTPIATYLMAVTASKFATFSHWYKKVTNPKDSIEIQYYIWQKDYDATKTDQTQYNAHNTFLPVVDMVTTYANKFIEYPFIKYGMVAIQPFSFGGMEHQTITSINRVWMRTADQFGVAHELAHQWLGDLITCATWKDVWINEGGATWSEGLWAEKLWGSPGYMDRMYWKRFEYMRAGGLSLPAIYDLPVNTIFGDNYILVYQKASWVYHQLRTMLGDSVYFPVLRKMLNKYAYKSIESEDFKNHFVNEVKNPPISLTTYFDQWLKHPGHPVFDIAVVSTKSGQDYNQSITINQVQKGPDIPASFETVVRMLFWGNNGTLTMDTLVVKQGSENFNVVLPFIPDSVKLDSSFSMFEIKTLLTTVQEDKGGSQIQKMEIRPNPASGDDVTYVLIPVKHSGICNIDLYDNLGNKLRNIYNSQLDEGTYKFSIPTESLPSGVYRIIYRNASKVESTQFVIVK